MSTTPYSLDVLQTTRKKKESERGVLESQIAKTKYEKFDGPQKDLVTMLKFQTVFMLHYLAPSTS